MWGLGFAAAASSACWAKIAAGRMRETATFKQIFEILMFSMFTLS
jgi:hypothetical protein